MSNIKLNSEKPKYNFKELLFEFNNLKKYKNSPRVDLSESDKSINVKIELAGICEKNINVKLQSSRFLIISGNKQRTIGNSFMNTIYEECYYGNFTRRVKLPSIVNNLFTKEFIDGVYYITLNKTIDTDNILYTIKEQETVEETVEETSNLIGKREKVSWADE